MKYILDLLIRLKLEKYMFDFNLRILFTCLRYTIIVLIFPGYWFYWFIYKFITSLWNKYPRAIFLDYTVTRKDNYFVMVGSACSLLVVLGFLISLEIDTLYSFINWAVDYFNFNLNSIQDYLNRVYMLYSYLKYWLVKTSIIAVPFVLFDQVLLKSKLKIDSDKPASKLRKYFLREKAIKDNKTFLGITRDKKREPFFVPDDQFSTHLSGMATTGAGKTELFFSLAYQNIKKGRGVTVVDCKGDLEFARKLYTFHKRHNPHDQEFKVINLGDPNFSNTYNFLLRGSALEVKDRLINAVEWSEQYYKNATVDVVLTLLQAVIEDLNKKITMKDLYLLMTEQRAVEIIQSKVENDFIKEQLQEIINNFEDKMSDCQGLINQINILCNSELGKIINHYNPDVDLFESYRNQEILYVTIPTNRLKETAKAFGRMLLSDLEATTSYIEEEVPKSEREKYSVTIDEFEAFATPDFVGWLNKARSAKYNIQIFYQSEGDLENIDSGFVKQIVDNTNLKAAGRVNDPETAENFAKQVGTQKSVKETARVNKDLLRQMEGELGSEREVEEFIVSPNEIRNLGIGQFVFLGKYPQNFKKVINVDYIEDPDDLEEIKLVKEDKKRVAEDERLNMEELLKQPLKQEETEVFEDEDVKGRDDKGEEKVGKEKKIDQNNVVNEKASPEVKKEAQEAAAETVREEQQDNSAFKKKDQKNKLNNNTQVKNETKQKESNLENDFYQ